MFYYDLYNFSHLDKYTTRDDPRDDPDYVEPPKPREVELHRDPLKGFGFVAGSERPVVVRFVTDGNIFKIMCHRILFSSRLI